MGFLADAAWADEDAVGFLGQEIERGGAGDEILVDVLGEVEVVGVRAWSGERWPSVGAPRERGLRCGHGGCSSQAANRAEK